ncbi:MAG: hypothetical protein ABIP95_04080 [Pelobium sp.]
MQMVIHKVKMDEEDEIDVQFWLGKSASDRIAEVTRLRYEYYTWLLGEFPTQIQKTVNRKKL